MSTRLVAVLGFSNGPGAGLHPVCASRLARAEQFARPEDVVLFTGWAAGRSAETEADLMAGAWRSPVRARLIDRGARTTLGNVVSTARVARDYDADEVVVVTSSWHARRASALLRAALVGSGVRIRVVTCDEPPAPDHGLRELASWALVPLLAVVAARTR